MPTQPICCGPLGPTAWRRPSSPASRRGWRRARAGASTTTERSTGSRSSAATCSGARSGTTAAWSRARRGAVVLGGGDRMPGDPRGEAPPTRWFPDARLNFAENLLDGRGRGVGRGRDRVPRRVGRCGASLTWGELRSDTAKLAAALRARGVTAGDRVAALLPNVPETIVAMLATASIGAIFSSSSPDFGTAAVLDRFGQIEPRVLFVGDGYWYGGKWFDTLGRLDALIAGLPSVELVVVVPYAQLEREPSRVGAARSGRLARRARRGRGRGRSGGRRARVRARCPSIIRSTSCTRRAPPASRSASSTAPAERCSSTSRSTVSTSTCRPGDRLFYFTTCGWMMWNWLASGLASGATLILYDGSPFHRARPRCSTSPPRSASPSSGPPPSSSTPPPRPASRRGAATT